MFTRKVVCVVFRLALALLIGLSSAAFSHAAEKNWKLSTAVPENHFLVPLVRNYCNELSKASGGKVVIELINNAVLATAGDHFDLIKEGIAQMGAVIVTYNPNRFQLGFFTALPFSSDDAETATKINLELIKKNLINEEWKELILAVPWCAGPFAVQSNKKLSTAEDFKGLRMAPAGGVLSMAYDAIGATGLNIQVHGGEAYLGLERGTLDATALNWSGASSLKFQEVTKFGYDLGLMGGPLCFIFINPGAWNSLTPEIQAAWKKVSEQQSLLWAKAYTDTDAKGKQAWKDLGKDVSPFPMEEKAKLAKKLLPVWQAWIQKHEARGKPAKEMYKTYVEVMKREGKPVAVKIPELYQE